MEGFEKGRIEGLDEGRIVFLDALKDQEQDYIIKGGIPVVFPQNSSGALLREIH